MVYVSGFVMGASCCCGFIMLWGFAMEKKVECAQKGAEKPQNRRSGEDKISRGRWIVRTLRRMEDRQKRIDRRTRMLAAGLRELFILGEDYVSMVACQDEIDVAILTALREAGATGRQTGELAAQLNIDHRDVSRRIHRMNRRMKQEIGEKIIQKYGHRWKLIPRLRRDFVVEHKRFQHGL
jgi:hypothetical protein